MLQISSLHRCPGLLISVRSAEEAAVALAGGADVVDVKEPSRGSLGAVDAAVVASVVDCVAGRVPVSAALGELDTFSTGGPCEFLPQLPAGVALVKLGLAGCRARSDWPLRWQAVLAEIAVATKPVAVVYGDWHAAGAPPPDEVLAAAVALGCPALLVDTWDKSAGTLLDHWPPDRLARFVRRVRKHGLAVVLAGGLSGASLAAAVRLRPDLVALRGAVCRGDRTGTICPDRVNEVRQAISAAWRPIGVACQ
jgi:(5-formylfuran-3-yl)methyl phosphate synthase